MSGIRVCGNRDNPLIVVVTDPPSKAAWEAGKCMSTATMGVFSAQAKACGFVGDNFCLITPSPPVPEEATTDSRVNAFMDEHREEFLSVFTELAGRSKLVMYLGKWAGRQVMGRSVKILNARGQIHDEQDIPVPVLPLLSPTTVLRRPEQADIFNTDFRLSGEIRDCGWSVQEYSSSRLQGRYRWCMDLEEEMDLDNPPKGMALDVETVGVDWYRGVRILCAQLSWKSGEAVSLPLDMEYWNDDSLRGDTSQHLPQLTLRGRMKIIHQLRRLCSNPKVHFVGHNMKFDKHVLRSLRVDIINWAHDTMQLAFVVDDNMQRKNLDECTRRWLPAMAGYADEFNRVTNKERMDLVPHDDMCWYGGGDTDATRQLCKVLVALAKKDVGNYRCYTRIQMPALRMFFETERSGLTMDKDALLELGEVARAQEVELRDSLLDRVSGKVKRMHLENPKTAKKSPEDVLSFNRADFTIDVLFGKKSEGGMGLIPKVFTKGTMRLPPEERIPSTSSKDHLPYFDHDPFVRDLIDYMKLSKLRSTYIGAPEHHIFSGVQLLNTGDKYVKRAQDILEEEGGDFCWQYLPPVDGEPEEVVGEIAGSNGKGLVLDANGRPWWRDTVEPTGFWQHLSLDSKIYPSFLLDRTVTGRSASLNPNGQNIPKRGTTERMEALVMAYRRCFVAEPGWVLIEGDLSQAELRLVAWMAQEPTMLQVYRDGGDIHKTTACAVLGISSDEFDALPSADKKLARFRAKAVNFGFIYGMWWKGFMRYAKTDFSIDLTEAQAEKTRQDFFNLYYGLDEWHTGMKNFATDNGYVRSLHGALRRLPSVYSDEESVQKEAQRQGINSPIQRFASDLGLIGMFRYQQVCPWDRIRTAAFIHDAVIVKAREECAEEAMSALKWHLETPPLLEWFGVESPIPLLSDVSVGHNLWDMEERDDIQSVRPEWAA